ncbi:MULTISPECIES: DUF397 domain-containing protein [Actinokineospora]|uniref:DUF397 domain-containing protein n=1 Tax=Actinokineospora fastidiosa TaxID=1816 RepID=A0A918GHW8_9PSEU|nr:MULTISPECIES: DUF397 domain-containing protein [Actinokineospora]UVS80856.1 hypothetical protein Actkin_04608 [Actinokineospora sp. UTMC 2448]GGS37704.1 DUF397 domain-containing protein [Actinokineospora fastidiosa]
MTADLARAQWRKSSRSGAGNDCVELVVHTTGAAIRDSKNTDHGHLALPSGPWAGFLGAVKADLLEH